MSKHYFHEHQCSRKYFYFFLQGAGPKDNDNMIRIYKRFFHKTLNFTNSLFLQLRVNLITCAYQVAVKLHNFT